MTSKEHVKDAKQHFWKMKVLFKIAASKQYPGRSYYVLLG